MAEIINEPAIFPGTTPWWEEYGVNHDPFTHELSAGASYISAHWAQHVDLMQLLVRHSYELLLIYGDIGCGKTTILKYFLEQLDDSLAVYRVKGNGQLRAGELLASMASSFNLPVQFESHQTVRAMVNIIVNAIIQRGERVLLVVDDAHLLDNETLSALLYLQQQRVEQQVPLAIIFSLDAKSEERVQQLTLDFVEPALQKAIRLQPFELEETEAYLLHRFQQAGHQGPLPVERGDVIHVHQWSSGIPGRINNVARKVMIDLFEQEEVYEEPTNTWREHQSKLMGGLVLLVILIAGFYIWDSQQNFSTQQQQNLAVPQLGNQSSRVVNSLGNLANSDAPGSAVVMNATKSSVNPFVIKHDVRTGALNTDSLVKATKAQQQMQAALRGANQHSQVAGKLFSHASNNPAAVAEGFGKVKPLPAAVTAGKVKSVETKIQTPTIESVASAKIVKPSVIQGLSSAEKAILAEKIQAQGLQVAASLHEKQERLAVKKALRIQAQKEKLLAEQLAKAREKELHNEKLAKAKLAKAKKLREEALAKTRKEQRRRAMLAKAREGSRLAEYSRDEQALLKMPSKTYTLQLAGVRHPNEIRKYIQRNGIKGNAKYFKTKYKGKSWYVLVYGRYSSHAAAARAIKRLPAKLRNQKPWIRSIASVKQAIKLK